MTESPFQRRTRWRFPAAGLPVPARKPTPVILAAAVGTFAVIAVLVLLTDATSRVLVLGSFGATCVLVFGYPEAPFSQPRNVFFGHVISSALGLACLSLFGATWWSVALGVASALAAMMLTRTTHPPAGSNPVIIFLTQPGWSFLLVPTAVGAAIIVVFALAYAAVRHDKRYPQYW